jgi:hypothetical protein
MRDREQSPDERTRYRLARVAAARKGGPRISGAVAGRATRARVDARRRARDWLERSGPLWDDRPPQRGDRALLSERSRHALRSSGLLEHGG